MKAAYQTAANRGGWRIPVRSLPYLPCLVLQDNDVDEDDDDYDDGDSFRLSLRQRSAVQLTTVDTTMATYKE